MVLGRYLMVEYFGPLGIGYARGFGLDPKSDARPFEGIGDM